MWTRGTQISYVPKQGCSEERQEEQDEQANASGHRQQDNKPGERHPVNVGESPLTEEEREMEEHIVTSFFTNLHVRAARFSKPSETFDEPARALFDTGSPINLIQEPLAGYLRLMKADEKPSEDFTWGPSDPFIISGAYRVQWSARDSWGLQREVVTPSQRT